MFTQRYVFSPLLFVRMSECLCLSIQVEVQTSLVALLTFPLLQPLPASQPPPVNLFLALSAPPLVIVGYFHTCRSAQTKSSGWSICFQTINAIPVHLETDEDPSFQVVSVWLFAPLQGSIDCTNLAKPPGFFLTEPNRSCVKHL